MPSASRWLRAAQTMSRCRVCQCSRSIDRLNPVQAVSAMSRLTRIATVARSSPAYTRAKSVIRRPTTSRDSSCPPMASASRHSVESPGLSTLPFSRSTTCLRPIAARSASCVTFKPRSERNARRTIPIAWASPPGGSFAPATLSRTWSLPRIGATALDPLTNATTKVSTLTPDAYANRLMARRLGFLPAPRSIMLS
jgi:hypothetical protein